MSEATPALTVEDLLGTWLGADATLQSLLGGNPPRIYNGRRPPKSGLPSLTFNPHGALEDTLTDNKTWVLSRPQYLFRVWYPNGNAYLAIPILDRVNELMKTFAGTTAYGHVACAYRVRPHGPFEPLIEGEEVGEIGMYYRFDVD